MGFFDKLKEFQNQINEVENNISSNKQDFLEIYERNVQLEKEIADRTKELNLANQRMLTLQHIWDMMNSSKPLSNVLDAIVKTLQGELGYLHSSILQIKEDENGQFLKVITQAQDAILAKVDVALGGPFEALRLSYLQKGVLRDTITSKSIMQTTDLRGAFRSVLPDYGLSRK